MIQANELRINNILNYQTAEDGIMPTTIDWQDLKWISENETDFNLAHSAIPLTEQILLDCGFKNNGLEFSGCKIYEYGVFRLFHHNLLKSYSLGHQKMSPPSTVFCHLKYLHTLQNTIHALTGNELTYNTK